MMIATSRVWALACVMLPLSASLSAQEVFPAPLVFPDGRVIIATADVDGDGDQDILRAVSYFGTDLVIDLNNGSGQFTPGVAQSVSSIAPQAPGVLVDITGDGNLDAVVSGNGLGAPGVGGQLIVVPGDGLGGLTGPSALPLSGLVTGMGVGDGDGDGMADVLVRYADNALPGNAINLQWFFTRVSGTPQAGPPFSMQAPTLSRNHIDTADLDGDGDADFAVRDLSLATPSVRIFFTQGGGSLSQGPLLPLSAVTNTANEGVLLTDADADGDVDALAYASTMTTLEIQVWSNGGTGAFSSAPTQSQPLTYGRNLQCFAGDWDADGDSDLMFRGMQGAAFTDPGGYNVFENNGAGTFTQRWAWPVAGVGIIGGVGFADLNGDGVEDFVGPEDLHFSPGSMQPPGAINPSAFGDDVFDADGDGDLDVIDPVQLNFHANDGRGFLSASPETRITFPASVPGFINGTPFYIDWDQDGDMDAFTTLIAFNQVANTYTPIQHEKWRNDGGSTYQNAGPLLANTSTLISFETGTTIGSNNSPAPMDKLARDYDGDGLLDLISDQSIYFQQASGVFARLAAPTFPGWRALAAGDVDADGDQDIVAIALTGAPPQLAVLRNIGGASFVATPIPSLANPTYTVDVGDLDGDLDLDLVVTNLLAQRTVQIVENTGVGFAPPITVPLPKAPAFDLVSIQDLNLDGQPDILLSRDRSSASISDRCYVLLQSQSGPLGFDPLKIYAIPSAAGIADMDGDGDLDCTGVATVFNTTIQGPGTGSRRQFGVGVPGASGLTPLIGATGPFRVGETGVLHLSGIPGGTPAIMAFGSQESNQIDFPVVGMTSYSAPWFALLPFTTPGALGVVGAGDLQIPAFFPASLANTSTYIQVAIADSGAALGFSTTGGLELVVN